MSSLQNKLLNCEVPPPAGTWDKIAAALDEDPAAEKEAYAVKLYELEVNPPATAWNKIESSLGEPEQAAPVKRISFFRYAAAAVLLAAIGFGVFQWTKTNKTSGLAVNKTIEPALAPAKPAVIPGAATIPATKEDTPSKETPQSDYVRLDQLGKLNMKKALAKARYTASATDAVHAVYAYEDHVPNLADRYVMLMTPEGNIIRMSKKLGDLICCVSGEEQGNDCKDQLKKWQEKLAMSSLAPSPGNFLDILSLVNSLEDSEL